MDHSGWWKGECNGRVGLFPQNFVLLEGEITPAVQSPELQPKAEQPKEKFSYEVLSNPSTIPSTVDTDNIEVSFSFF